MHLKTVWSHPKLLKKGVGRAIGVGRVCLFVCLLGSSGGAGAARAQSSATTPPLYDVQYRSAEARYLVGRYPHFDLIYQEGTEATAFRIAAHLEAHRAATDSLVGRTGAPFRMPVVVNGYNDRANGIVSPLPFRQEIEAPGIKSDALTTYFSSWPAAVAPHELVHAAHAEVHGGVGVGGLARLLAPDWSRIVNLTAPRGLTEGAAVYYESRLEPRAGRLNTPLATMAFRAAMLSDDPWSLAQMLEAPAYTRPFDRHYLGGGQAFAHLAEREEAPQPRFFHRATRFHHRLPFLGFGAALWYGTGARPGALDAAMQRALIERERARHEARRPFTEVTVLGSASGLVHRRPHWIDDTTLVVHASGYASRPGFYAVDARSGRRRLLSPQAITEDYAVSVSRDTSALYFSQYVPDRLVPGRWRAEALRLDLRDGTARPVSRGGRVHAPVEAPGGTVWALRNDGAFNQWAAVQPDGTARPLTALGGVRFETVAPSPSGDTLAVVLNVAGRQRLYRAAVRDDGRPVLTPWLAFDGAAIYDVTWGPRGRYLLLSADPDSVANVYVLDTRRDVVRRLTNVPFGALEPTLSPDGRTLAFVSYQHERFDLVRMPFRPEAAPRVREAWLLRTWPLPSDAASSEAPGQPPETAPYRPARYLAPRVLYPTFAYDFEAEGEPLGLKLGVGVAGADPLRRWTYAGEAFYRMNRFWGEAQLQTGAHVLRPALSVYRRPYAVGPVAVEERGVELRVGAPVVFDANVFHTQARFQLGSALRQTRLVDGDGEALSDFRSRWTLRPAVVLGYRLQANPRDLIPNHGVVVRSQAELDAWTQGQAASRGWLSAVRVYLPFLRATNTGLSAYARLLTQRRGAVFSAEAIRPRGFEGRALGAGTFGQVGAEVVQPVAFVDDGLTLLPLYVKAVYVYGFAETLRPLHRAGEAWSSVGGGMGVRLRFFYALDLDLRVGAAFRWPARDVHAIYR